MPSAIALHPGRIDILVLTTPSHLPAEVVPSIVVSIIIASLTPSFAELAQQFKVANETIYSDLRAIEDAAHALGGRDRIPGGTATVKSKRLSP